MIFPFPLFPLRVWLQSFEIENDKKFHMGKKTKNITLIWKMSKKLVKINLKNLDDKNKKQRLCT